QNAEDNEYLEGVKPSLEFIITSRDITATGAPATLLMLNNEKGFSSKNIESICSVGRSTKKGNRKCGYIGEKGIGFKSVFLITAQPYIFSKGYQIRFNEGPCPHCNLGYIVPEWVEDNPSLYDLRKIYGSGSTLPTTTIVLPLKPDKVNPVKQQLSSIHPEVLLFLSKIKRFSVREINEDPKLNTVSAIAITSETNFETRKNIDAESYMLHLSAKENGDALEKESYYMWRQKFHVQPENKVERRMEVDELVITLAFPNQEPLHRGMSLPGVYAFLPTEMVTNLPFIIQADFVLASSRETILLDDKWNQGILDCVSTAFVNAFISLVKTTEDAPLSSLPRMFEFLPVNTSSYPKLNVVRESIKRNLVEEDIVPSESYMKQKFFHKPSEVGRIMPAFWDILKKAKKQGVSLQNLSSHGRYVLNSSFDKEEYDHILNFLGVKPVNSEWYAKCIQSSNIVLGVSEDVYSELLLFIADNWSHKFQCTNIKDIPLLKYVDLLGNVSLFSINGSIQQYGGQRLCRSSSCLSWLIYWNREFRYVTNLFFMPITTVEAINLSSKKETLVNWLDNQVKVKSVTLYDYADDISKQLCSDRKLVITYVHFLYHSFAKKYLSESRVDNLCRVMPLVDNYGYVSTTREGVLVPAKGSNWSQLMLSNPWRREGYIELSEDYLRPGTFAGVSTTGAQLIEFLKSHLRVSDIPYITPPNDGIPAVSAPLTRENAFLLLEWISNLKSNRIGIPAKFLACIKEGSWLKINMNGSSGCRPPSQSFMLSSSWGNILQNGSMLVDIPLIDKSFYGDRIHEYTEKLKTIGVMFEFGEACAFIGKQLMSLATSYTLTRRNVLSILNFIKFLREKYLSPTEFISSIKLGRWLRTCQGVKSPDESVLFNQDWRVASMISDIPFIDQGYYGEEILEFKTELQLLGVVVDFNKNNQKIVGYLKSPLYLGSLPADATLLILLCMSRTNSSDRLVKELKSMKCLKTNMGYKSPGECFWFDPEWGCLLQVFSVFPLIDHEFYGSSIFNYKTELETLGVLVQFEEASKAFARYFRQQALSSSITRENVMSFLLCYRKLKDSSLKFPQDLRNCIHEVKWLRTRLGHYRSPRDCILYGREWESIFPITILPFIDDSDNCYGKGIHEYEKELKKLKVVVEFKEGVKSVAAGLYIPHDPSCIIPANVFTLLECIKVLLEKRISFPEAFLKKVSQKWLKTYAGYRAPDECLLFDSKWDSFLKRTDGPFLDEEFYGSNITSYRGELSAIGVTVDVKKGCSLLACHIDFHSEFDTIVRIYNYLKESNWEPDSGAARRIWIPNGSKNGEWVNPEECILCDKDGLFGLQLNVLEKHYDELLSFFSCAFGVKTHPTVDDYCKLWKSWEESVHKLSLNNCYAFWGNVMKQWSLQTKKTLTESLAKLPVVSNADGILLVNKCDVFIGDDLQIKDLFQQFSPHPIFVWLPQPSLHSLPHTRMLEIYGSIGVRKISESVQKEKLSLGNSVKLDQVDSRDTLICKGLVKLILGFLADPSFKMEAKKRHEAVQCLLNLTILETVESISVSYTLSLSSGEVVNAKANHMIRWDRENSKLFAQKMDRSGGHKNVIEYATYFTKVIAEGVLWEKEDHISALSEMIKVAFLLEFNEEAIGFLMKSKNLQVFMEDESFLSAAFPS
ncbi:LOW QUALITY PROTEIN: hypothetical protein CFOL_v3_30715, partial [Cephalotus follicularis]